MAPVKKKKIWFVNINLFSLAFNKLVLLALLNYVCQSSLVYCMYPIATSDVAGI